MKPDLSHALYVACAIEQKSLRRNLFQLLIQLSWLELFLSAFPAERMSMTVLSKRINNRGVVDNVSAATDRVCAYMYAFQWDSLTMHTVLHILLMLYPFQHGTQRDAMESDHSVRLLSETRFLRLRLTTA